MLELLISHSINLILTALFSYLTYLVKKYIDDKKLEDLVVQSIQYTEEYTKNLAKNMDIEIKGSEKLDIAKQYIDKIQPGTIEKYSEYIEDLIVAKIASMDNVGTTDTAIK